MATVKQRAKEACDRNDQQVHELLGNGIERFHDGSFEAVERPWGDEAP